MNKIEELELRQQLADVSSERDGLRVEHDKRYRALIDMRDERDAIRTQLNASEARNSELSIYESFPCYLIDHCEGATVYEESLQHWLAEHIKALDQSAPATDEHCSTCSSQNGSNYCDCGDD